MEWVWLEIFLIGERVSVRFFGGIDQENKKGLDFVFLKSYHSLGFFLIE